MTIVVGLDETPHAERVLSKAIAEAKRRGEALHAVHVYHPPALYLSTSLAEPVRFREEHRDQVWERLSPLLDSATVEHERVDLDGHPGETLVDYLANVSASLVIVGNRGRGEFRARLLGSTSAHLSHAAPCDVLIVKT